MINVPHTLEVSQCSERFQSEWWWTFQGYYFLFPHYSFQCCCRPLWCLHLHCNSQKLSPPPLPLYPMNFLHCSRSRKYFRYFGSRFPFSIKSRSNFLFLIKPLSIPNSATPSRNVSIQRTRFGYVIVVW